MHHTARTLLKLLAACAVCIGVIVAIVFLVQGWS